MRAAQRLLATRLLKDDSAHEDDFGFLDRDIDPRKAKPLVPGFTYQDFGGADMNHGIIHDGRVVGFLSFSEDYRSDRILNPHSKMYPEFRGRGLMKAMYQVFLNKGYCLISGKAHTRSANRVWASLAKSNPWFIVSIQPLRNLGQAVAPRIAQSEKTRIVLLGRGWTDEKFMQSL